MMPKLKNLFSVAIASSLAVASTIFPGQNQQSAVAATDPYCKLSIREVNRKEQLLKDSLAGNKKAAQTYDEIVKRHSNILQQCRNQNWPQTQAIWLRLYPCDVSTGSIDHVLDRIVNLGYNQVHLEVFYDSQVLLPPAENNTPWISVVRAPGAENVDLLEQAIAKGRKRGLKVYAWMFGLNFGYSYAQDPTRQDTLARNSQGDNSLNFVNDRSQAFIDPYNKQVQSDYYNLVKAVLKRKPDGILFDYIRYPQGSGEQFFVDNVKDLWIYGSASLQTIINRATNQKGKALISKYVNQGEITIADVQAVDRQFPKEGEPSWQGRATSNLESNASTQARHARLQSDLWFFSVAHAAQGVIDFVSFAAAPVLKQRIPAGGVFFPDGNRLVDKASFDSRLQAWDKLPSSLEWHAMSYAVCEGTDCILREIGKVVDAAPSGTKITPALAGVWGAEYRDHPSLEQQMAAIRQAFPQLNSISHFAYSWQEPEIDKERRFCKLQ